MEILINTKFNVGDKVYYIEPVYTKVDCDLCNGKGLISLSEEYEVKCPKCHGDGYGNFGQVYELCDSNYKHYIKYVLIRMDNIELHISYTIVTYRGLSTIAEEDVFRTIEEAQVECDKRNESTVNQINSD